MKIGMSFKEINHMQTHSNTGNGIRRSSRHATSRQFKRLIRLIIWLKAYRIYPLVILCRPISGHGAPRTKKMRAWKHQRRRGA